MPFKGIRRELRTLREARPGARFQGGHDRLRVGNRVIRWWLISLGLTISVMGALTFWLPGPNFVLVFGGLALVAAQWGLVARQLDRGEMTARRLNDSYWDPLPHKRWVLLGAWAIVLAVVAAAIWLAYDRGWLPAWVPFLG